MGEGELLIGLCGLGGSILGGYYGVKIGLAVLKADFKWLKEIMDKHIADKEIHHSHRRADDPTGVYHRFEG